MRRARFAVLALAVACQCGDPDFGALHFSCAKDADCAAGLACVQGLCAAAETDGGGLDAGATDAGAPPDGGQPDAGTADSGQTDAGALQDAGTPDGGPSDAGLQDAGCVPESDAVFCAALGLNCGAVAGQDNCNLTRTANCGCCDGPGSCVGNVCQDAGVCATGWACGSACCAGDQECFANACASMTNVCGYAINSGGGAVAPFVADEYFDDGGTYQVMTAIDTTGVTNPAPQLVYQSERYDGNTYLIPNLVPGAAYTVRLHFAEIYWTDAGQRLFAVVINGDMVLNEFDIVAAAGGPNAAVVEAFPATADVNGQIEIDYVLGSTDLPKSSGVEIIPQ